jgi:CRP/FNR family transcriptional regulator, cyclic AMP receptor protein
MLSDRKRDEMLAQMSEDPWFGTLGLELRRAMLMRCKLNPFSVGQFVFRQGDAPSGFFGLVRGALKVSTLSEDGKEGVLAVLEPGNWFGEASALDGLPRTHDVSIVAPAVILTLEHRDFDELMRGADFAGAIARLQARHIRALYAMLEDATLRSTRARIVRRLQWLARGDATMAPVDRRVIHITHTTLAMMLGITRQTLALELKELEAGGAISMSYRRITISSMKALRAMERKGE